MAIATGSQIRPELSAVDYTPFLQASGQSAQMQAQGITSAVGGALKGFESIVQQQKENKQLEAEIKSAERLGNSLQSFLKDVSPEAQTQFGKMIAGVSDPNLSLRERASNAKGIGSALTNIISLAELGKKAQDEKSTAEYAGMLRAGGGKIPSPVSNEVRAGFTPAQQLSGEERYLRAEKQKADIEGIRAEAKARGVPKVQDLSFQEQAVQQELAALESKLGRKATPQEQAETYAKVAQQSRSTSTVNVGATAAGKIYDDLRLNQNNIRSLREVISNYGEAIDEISKRGAFSGPAGSIKYVGAKALQVFGNDTFKTEADAYQIAGSSLASAVLGIAKQLPGAASDRDVMFLERVAKGDEKVPSAEVLKGIRKRVESKLARSQTAFKRELNAFKAASKEDSTAQLYYNVLSASEEPDTTSGSAQPTLKPFPK
tara:strand:+ start:547 stop:1839 length:1293 start_codon:yes stop_codon:yes gene_type:complete